MGTWNARLFSNDTTLDVKDTYINFLKQQFSNEEAYQKTYEEYKELMGTDEEALFWYALADTQWNVGRLTAKVRDKALEFIYEKGGMSFWMEIPNGASKWESTLQKLKCKIESPMPAQKKFAKPIKFTTNPWNIGDIYAYQLHYDKAVKNGFSGKYILFQKIGDVEYFKDLTYSLIQPIDKIFDFMPTLDMINNIHGLTITNDNYAYEYYLMLYEKKSHYPKKYLTFIGNKKLSNPNKKYNPMDLHRNCVYWDQMDCIEDWLIDYYLSI